MISQIVTNIHLVFVLQISLMEKFENCILKALWLIDDMSINIDYQLSTLNRGERSGLCA